MQLTLKWRIFWTDQVLIIFKDLMPLILSFWLISVKISLFLTNKFFMILKIKRYYIFTI